MRVDGQYRIRDLGCKDTITPPFDNAPEWANFVAMDGDGEWWWFERKPRRNDVFDMWASPGGRTEAVYTDWSASLRQRP